MRPSTHLVKKPIGYGTTRLTHWPFTNASSDEFMLPVAIGVFSPSPLMLNQSTQV